MSRARIAVAVAAAFVGAAAGLALGLGRDDHYEAAALLLVLPAPQGAETPEESRRADVQARTYASLASVQQSERTRALQAEDELRRRIAVIDADIETAQGDDVRQESLRAQRVALAERLAAMTESGLAGAGGLVLAAPAAEARWVRAEWWPWALGGAAIGLLAGLTPARRPRRRLAATLVAPAAGAFLRGSVPVWTEPPRARVEWSADGVRWHSVRRALDTTALPDGRYLLRTPGAPEATPVVVDNTPPTVALSPSPRFSGGVVLLDAEAEDAGSGVASVGYMVSAGGTEWTEIPAEFAPERPGVYWFCAVAADRAGNKAASERIPVQVSATL
jgi:hypothetical protein